MEDMVWQNSSDLEEVVTERFLLENDDTNEEGGSMARVSQVTWMKLPRILL
jgi:hypothetical protein